MVDRHTAGPGDKLGDARGHNARDREAEFHRLVERHYRQVHRFFSKRGFSEEDCRDLTQETFLGIYKGLATFRHHARFETWLFQIAANTYRKALRDRNVLKRRLDVEARSMTDLPYDIPADGGPLPSDPQAQALSGERRRRLREAVEALPAKMRACLAMRIYQERSYQEIATAMRLSVETVKAHLYQARQRLKKDLGDDTDGALQTRRGSS